MHEIIQSIILGIVEGITEFLPISSTGHLILVNEWLNFTGEFAKTFDVVIQLGAILSVVVYFHKRLIPFGPHLDAEQRNKIWLLWKKTLIGIIPALILGALFGDIIEEHLFNPTVVAISLCVGGIVLIFLERGKRDAKITEVNLLPYKLAFFIGICQCLAMVPGVSRSAATIIGAMLFGCSRMVAAEFSFFLAIPTMAAASGYSMLKLEATLGTSEIIVLITGFVVSFIVALVVIAAFIKYVSRHDFKVFGVYRVILGGAVLVYFLLQRG